MAIENVGDNGKETVLQPADTCYIGSNERREIINRGNAAAALAEFLQDRQLPGLYQC